MHALPIIALVIALVALLRTRRRSWGCGGPWGHGHKRAWGWRHCGRHCGHRGEHHGRHHGWRGRAFMYALFERLDLSPAQDKALSTELGQLRDKMAGLRDEAGRSRADVAAVVAAESFDKDALDAMFSRHDERLAEIRGEVAAALRRIHELLDAEQREKLADLIGAGKGFWRGPYR